MHYVLVRHKIKDYDKWKRIYDENMENRKNNGSKGGHVLKGTDDPDEIVILFEWDDLDNARKFYRSEETRKRMEKAGVENPEIHYLEGIGKTTA
ncbi:MAG: cyclase [Methanobacterium sp.]|nr:cyclase [Methanobacterium sp.]